ncbi:MAG: hypothetical protein OEN01_07530 [Candidatus Krumholzibacteria bacterium]|nr:hypothetical protein [Candidatus Krumholzibacteria bacterium]
MTSSASKNADRIFVRDGRRLYRRKFSVTENRLGILILFVLASILLWVAWKGANPDPTLFMLETDLAQPGVAKAVDRGPVPTRLAGAGWSEGAISQFDQDNLYVKINGREGYYKSFGFERLYFLSILSIEDEQTAVDIELYDLGNAANAVGAYSGERSPEVTPVADDSGMMHMDRNALFLIRGRFYLRAIGSGESPEVRSQLEHLRSRFQSELPGEPLPWGYALFVGRMGMDPGALSYALENAFSFGFARNVYSAALQDDAELFVTPAGSKDDAEALARRFLDGFRQYGTDEGDFVKDRYLGTYATAAVAGGWVVGIRGATDTGKAREAVTELVATIKEFPLPTDTTATTMENRQEEHKSDEY